MTQKQITDMLYNGLSYAYAANNYERDGDFYEKLKELDND